MSDAFVAWEAASVHVDGGRAILDRLTLAVREGETLGLIGRSGSGKTTALRLVNALVLPTAGVVRVAGRATTDWDPIQLRRRTGYVIQEIGLLPHLTVADNAGIVPELEGWEAARRRARVAELLHLVGLAPDTFGRRYPHELSGGQRQRVGVARALAADPPLLLLDEPFGALDPITRRELQEAFRELQRRLRKTAVFVTHDLREAARVADRWALLDAGALLATGTPDELAASADPAVRAFLDAGRGCVIAEIVAETGRHLLLVAVSVGAATLIGVPLGIALTRRPAWQRWVLGAVNAIQTVPSLALFGLLIPVPFVGGIGMRTALVALTLYALLPVLRNTVVGIGGVDPAAREAGRGLGMTGAQLLRRVELPLAASTILAGIRLATVIGIGLATIAAAIGAGGLGVFIFRGVAMVDNRTILAGALPAAALALAADTALGALERRLRPPR